MRQSIYMTPIVANDVLYITTKDTLYAISDRPPLKPSKAPPATTPCP